MFVVSVKATRRHLILTVLCVAAIAAVLIAGWIFPAERTMMTVAPINGSDDAACASFLRSLGYAAQLPAAEVREIRLPDTFSEELSAYNDIQQSAQFDLSGYSGLRVKYRTYQLVDGGTAHIYVYNDHIIGGDITDTAGAMLPLCKATALPH